MPSCAVEWGGGALIQLKFSMQTETPTSTLVVTKSLSVLPRRWTYTHSHTSSEGLIQGVKGFIDPLVRRLWPQCCWCYCPPTERIIKEAHTCLCVYMQLHEGAFELSSKTNNYQQHRLIISSNVSSIKKTCLSSPHKLPQMWLRLQFSLLPVQPAGQIQPHQLCTLLGSLLLQGPLQTPPSPRAPPPHPLPFLRSPEATQVPEEVWEEACRAGATALNACWRPLVAPLRIITTPMGLAGPELWRTSTRSTEMTRIERFIFCLRKMQEHWSDTEHSAHKSLYHTALYPFVFVLRTFPVSWICQANNARQRNPAPFISVALFQIQRQKLITQAEGCNQIK